MPYESYKDSNGVTWTVITTQNGFTMLGTVLDSADPRYDPPAEDIVEKMAQGGVQIGPIDVIHTDPPTPEQTRVLFTGLVKKIEAYAKSHKGPVLKVTAKPTNWTALVLVGAALYLLYEGRPRRRRRR